MGGAGTRPAPHPATRTTWRAATHRAHRTNMDNLRITAIHEAGHAVAAVRTGLVFDVVSAIPDDERELDGALDWIDLHSGVEIEMPREALALVLLAGACAEAKLRGLRFDRVFSGVGAMDDRDALAGLMLSPEQFLAVSRDVVALVEQDWAVIERIAGKLETGAELDYEAVEAIVIEVDEAQG
jgi:hypothetical protein